MSKVPLIAVVGETASGKSSVAMELGKRFGGEIVNADSWQIYKGMDVGTAKPSKTDQEEVTHHLLDVVEPDEDFTAAIYKRMAVEAIDKIDARGRVPIMVGGTGLYIDGVLFDYSFLPPGNPYDRERWQSMEIAELINEINNRGYSLDGIDTRNKRRLVRLLENEGREPSRSDLRENTCVVGIYTSRTKLRSNIEQRVEQMFRAGLRHEVRELAEQYGWEAEAMKGIGYKEFYEYFYGTQSMTETKRKIVKNTLELAKRQRTWFKRNRAIIWVTSTNEAIDEVEQFLRA